MCQRRYVDDILKRFGMEDCKAVSSPVDMSSRLVSSDAATKVEAPCREAVGALMHLTTATRPDIAYSVGYVSRSWRTHKKTTGLRSSAFCAIYKAPKRMESTTSRVARSTFVDIRTQTGPVTSPTASRLLLTVIGFLPVLVTVTGSIRTACSASYLRRSSYGNYHS